MENSQIEWTDHTFNPWWGCMKVSEGCKNCYAESQDARWNGAENWGPNSNRLMQSDKYWLQPFKWNEAARKAGIKAKVFCASMADVFEDHPDVVLSRERLFAIIADTPNLIWQLLTKRPENINTMVPANWLEEWPVNVWIGTSVENQEAADKRIPHLLNLPAYVRFLSCEPLLGPVDLSEYMRLTENNDATEERLTVHGWGYNGYSGGYIGPGGLSADDQYDPQSGIQWVICGGESGPKARPMHPDWAKSLYDQCKDADVSFFFKQWGEYLPDCQADSFTGLGSTDVYFQSPHNPDKQNKYWKIGKKTAGSLLDGNEWKEFPL